MFKNFYQNEVNSFLEEHKLFLIIAMIGLPFPAYPFAVLGFETLSITTPLAVIFGISCIILSIMIVFYWLCAIRAFHIYDMKNA